MAKRKEDEVKPGAPAWQSTFADLMNLLLCFFVLLFSMSTVDAQKFEMLAASFNQTFSIFTAGATAIGDGIATSLNRLKEGKAKSQSIILLTDGSNNTGIVAPLTAADIAKEMNVKIYTIGIGSNTTALMPVRTDFGTEYQEVKVVIDEATLQQIANETGGQYFRATNNKVLSDVFKEIDKLEKTRMDVHHFTHTEDDYMNFAWIDFALIFVDLLLRYTVTRSIP